MITLVPNSFGSPVREYNPHHEPKGTSKGGQFAKAPGGGAEPLGGTLPTSLAPHAAKLAQHREEMHARSYNPANRWRSVRFPTEDELDADPDLAIKYSLWQRQDAENARQGMALEWEQIPEFFFRPADPAQDIETLVYLDPKTAERLPVKPVKDNIVEGGPAAVMTPGGAYPDALLIHTHPSSSAFSREDLHTGLRAGNPAVMVFGKDGSWYHMDLAVPSDPIEARRVLRKWELVINEDMEVAAQYSQDVGTAKTLALMKKLGVDDARSYDRGTRENKIATEILRMYRKAPYAEAIKELLTKRGFGDRFTYHLAPIDIEAEAQRLARTTRGD